MLMYMRKFHYAFECCMYVGLHKTCLWNMSVIALWKVYIIKLILPFYYPFYCSYYLLLMPEVKFVSEWEAY